MSTTTPQATEHQASRRAWQGAPTTQATPLQDRIRAAAHYTAMAAQAEAEAEMLRWLQLAIYQHAGIDSVRRRNTLTYDHTGEDGTLRVIRVTISAEEVG